VKNANVKKTILTTGLCILAAAALGAGALALLHGARGNGGPSDVAAYSPIPISSDSAAGASSGASGDPANPGAATSSAGPSTSSPAFASKASPSSTAGASTSAPAAPASGSAVSSAPVPVTVTIPEGYSFMQVAGLLDSKGICPKADFYSAAQAYRPRSFTIPSSASRCFNLEGYLFPDTYTFNKGSDPTETIITLLNNYAAKSGMPSDSTLILASIIEREARSTENMKLVSSVFHNRLAAGMRLDADSTREYVNNFITGNPLVAGASKYAALYNTYKCASLPAGPICCPGARAIDAAKNPTKSDYLYFFFGKDNQNHYSKTLEEQQQQIAKYGVQDG